MNIESVVLDDGEVRKLLGAASGDGALLYIYLKSANPVADAAKALNLTPARVSCAMATQLLHQLRHLRPVPGGITTLTAGNIYLETGLGVGFKSVSHFGSDSKAVCSVEWFAASVVVCIVKYIPGVGGQFYEPCQIFRLFTEDSKEINDITVNIIYRLNC